MTWGRTAPFACAKVQGLGALRGVAQTCFIFFALSRGWGGVELMWEGHELGLQERRHGQVLLLPAAPSWEVIVRGVGGVVAENEVGTERRLMTMRALGTSTG